MLDLSSMRAGGATDLYAETENIDVVIQRGGWTDRKMLQIYIQELVSTTYMSELPLETLAAVKLYADMSAVVWHRTFCLLQQGTPAIDLPACWTSGSVSRDDL